MNASVAQLDRASGYGPEGREFKSCPTHEENSFQLLEAVLFLSYIGGELKNILRKERRLAGIGKTP